MLHAIFSLLTSTFGLFVFFLKHPYTSSSRLDVPAVKVRKPRDWLSTAVMNEVSELMPERK